MNSPVGIRREDKNEFEARVPIIPADMRNIIKKTGAKFIVQPSEIRTFPDSEYEKAGAVVNDDLSDCPVVFAVKEIPEEFLLPGRTYMFFSHTIKGQDYNMSMLRRLIELKCNLIDYETVTDNQNRRLIFFGRFAGLAGMIDTLWAFGQRLSAEALDNPFAEIRQAYHYGDLESAIKHISEIGKSISKNGIPTSLRPLVVGFAGYGNVSLGAQEIFDLLPHKEVAPEDLGALFDNPESHGGHLYKVVFKEEHLVEPVDGTQEFELLDYYHYPEKYRSQFEKYIPKLTILVNCIFWDTMYPRLITKQYAHKHYSDENPRLKVIGDISCDIEGSIEMTLKATHPDKPAYLYDVDKDRIVDAFTGKGPVIMAVDNLPCELPKESSIEFSQALSPFVPGIIDADFAKSFDESGLPDEIKNATILYKGQFTPKYDYMKEFIE
ncbi:MAG: hypothetical protein GF315_09855 [candidate division Zixibacteria bacterium]|nr:hypothetical protein [candidate division Zixibacteria bacterium]